MVNIVILNCSSTKNDRHEGLTEISDQLHALTGLKLYSRIDIPINGDEVKFFKEKIEESQLILILVTPEFIAASNTSRPSVQQKVIKVLTLDLINNKEKIVPISYSTNNFEDCELFCDHPMKLPSNSTIIDTKYNYIQQWNDVGSSIREHVKKIDSLDLRKKINELCPISIDVPGGILCESEQYKLVGKMEDFIKPACFDSLYASMSDPSHVVIVYGPSGCGKTFIVNQISHEIDSHQNSKKTHKFDYINCQHKQDAAEEIREKLRDVNSGSRIIIDSFHTLNNQTRQFIMEKSIEIMESGSKTLLVIIGNTSLSNILIKNLCDERFDDLYDVYSIDFSTHSSTSIRNMMDKVAERLEIKFHEDLKTEIIKLSVDNIYIANFLIIKFMKQFASDINEKPDKSVFNLKKRMFSYNSKHDLYKIVEGIGLGERESFFNNFQENIVPINSTILRTISIHPKRGVISFKRLKIKSDNETATILNEITDKLRAFKISVKNKRIVDNYLVEQFKQSFEYQEDQEKLIIRNIQTLFYLNYSSIEKLD
jgi:hypothetical protein